MSCEYCAQKAYEIMLNNCVQQPPNFRPSLSPPDWEYVAKTLEHLASPLSDPTPLTLEELRGMLDEWVWVELFRDCKRIYSGYGYVIQTAPLSARILPENPGYATESDLLKGNARFYIHKPKHSEVT